MNGRLSPTSTSLQRTHIDCLCPQTSDTLLANCKFVSYRQQQTSRQQKSTGRSVFISPSLPMTLPTSTSIYVQLLGEVTSVFYGVASTHLLQSVVAADTFSRLLKGDSQTVCTLMSGTPLKHTKRHQHSPIL